MTIKTTFAAIALISATGTATFAGSLSDVGISDQQIVVIEDDETGGFLPVGSLGDSGAVLPLLIAITLFAAVASGGGS